VLPNRINIVITRGEIKGGVLIDKPIRDSSDDKVLYYTNNHKLIAPWLWINHRIKKWFVIGGIEIFKLFNEIVDEVYITHINEDHKCDQILDFKNLYYMFDYRPPFTKLDEYHTLIERSFSNHPYKKIQIRHYKCHTTDESEIMEHIDQLLDKKPTQNRTGVPRLMDCGRIFTINAKRFPLLTHRKMWLKGMFEELMFNLRGQSDSKILEAKGVNVWKKNTSREFLDKCGLQHLPVGDIGPSYGFNMRHFGAEYKTCHDNYDGKGFDQIAYCLEELKKDPYTTRALINLYDPSKVKQAPLPPCVYSYQFVRDANDKLNLIFNQRSSDIALAGGWNLGMSALLLYMFCAELSLEPGVIYWNTANSHVYENNIEKIKTFTEREPRPFPLLAFKRKPENITDYEFDDLILINYNPHPAVELEMVA
jgi:thymidylate synthase